MDPAPTFLSLSDSHIQSYVTPNERLEDFRTTFSGEQESPAPRKPILKIASIDGGGSRGIIPAMMMDQIEKITGSKISELFDLIAGTSTGAIIATALNIPTNPGSLQPLYTAADIVDLFEEQSKVVFPSSFFSFVWQPFTSKYSPTGLYSVLKTHCGDFRLSESLTEVLIPAAEVSSNTPTPWIFTKQGVITKTALTDLERVNLSTLRAWEISAASAAAETYFPLKPLDIGSQKYLFVDGGNFSNNPSWDAVSYAESLGDTPQVVVSFGTGYCPTSMAPSWSCNSGSLYWAANFPTTTLNLAAENVISNLQMTFNRQGRNLFVLQPKLDAAEYVLDGSTPAHMQALKKRAYDYIEENKGTIERICRCLKPNYEPLHNDSQTDCDTSAISINS